MDDTAAQANILLQKDPSKPLSAEDLVSLEGLIIGYLAKIERHKEVYNKQKEMLDNIFEHSPEFKEAAAQAKEANGKKNQIKKDLLSTTETSSLNDKVKELKSELRHLQDTLSVYLQQYVQNAATNQIEDDEGQVHEIIYVAKVVKRSSKYRT